MVSSFIVRALLCVSCLVVLATPAGAQTPRYNVGSPILQQIFVDPAGGDDRASGRNSGEAVRTIREAWNRVPRNTAASALVAGGYEIVLLPGEYPESAIPVYMELRYGSATAPIVFRAANGPGTAILRAGLNIANVAYLYMIDLDIVPTPAADVYHCELCDHILLKGVTFNGGVRPAEGSDAPVAHETVKINQSTHVYIEDSNIGGADDNAIDFVAVQDGHIIGNRVHGAQDWCGYVKGGSANILVDGNEFYDCGTGGFTAGQGTGLQFMSDPWLHYEAYGIRIVNNIVHDTEGAGIGVNGGYNVLVAWNTLYRVGTRSHLIEVVFGARSCDAADVAPERAACESRIAAGAWGTTAVDDGDNFVRIPNQHVFIMNNVVFNPAGQRSEYQHFQVAGHYANPSGPGSPSSNRGDSDLRIAGNVVWNGPAEHALGLGDGSCESSHPTCNESYVRANNQINTREPSFADLGNRDVRPAGSLLNERSVAVPDFDWSDMPSRPKAPAGERSNRVAFDRHGRARGASDPPGAAVP
ncbi:MAG TPA: right-handed parallel beta-helix repeat-containing protein [Vicinamibacterales bacterium]|nr:right-handed parallel beta-helix repeat-containing protein [Vicinamibacterales bacterium]